MSDELSISKEASDVAIHNALNLEAKELYGLLFQNQWEVLESDTLLEPNYLMVLCKERFYKRGGDPLKAYTVEQYADLMAVPVDVVSKWVETKPGFFVWLHQKRTFEQEINSILLVMSRSMFNEFKDGSLRDKSQAINSLSKFSTLMSPKKQDADEIDKLLEDVTEPHQVAEILESFGYVKRDDIDNFNEDRINIDRPLEDEDDIVSLEELINEDA